MDWSNLSAWSSAHRAGPFPLECQVVLINASILAPVTTADPCFFYTVEMPANGDSGQPLVFHSVFLSERARYLLLADQQKFYYRALKESEWEILRSWWDEYYAEETDDDPNLSRIQLYLQRCPPKTRVYFETKFGRRVSIFPHKYYLYHDQWYVVQRPGLVIQFLRQAVRFWILVEGRVPRPSQALDPKVFYQTIADPVPLAS